MWLKWIDADLIDYTQETPTRVKERAQRLFSKLAPFIGGVCDATTLKRLDKEVLSSLSNTVARNILKTEIRSVLGEVLTREKCLRLAKGIAGGYSDATAGLFPGIFLMDRPIQDCLVYVRSYRTEERPEETSVLIRLNLTICNSVYAGQYVEAMLRLEDLSRIGRWAGATNFRTGVQFQRVRLLPGIQFIARIERLGGELELVGVSVLPDIAKRNYQLTRSRHRKHAVCPYGAEFDCWECEVGRNQCDRSGFCSDTSYELVRIDYVDPKSSDVYESIVYDRSSEDGGGTDEGATGSPGG